MPRLTPRARAKARRNQEIREYQNRITELELQIGAQNGEITKRVDAYRQLETRYFELATPPIHQLTKVAHMPVKLADEAGIIQDLIQVGRWLKRLAEVAGGNQVEGE